MVSSRQTATGRSGSSSASTASEAATRRGDSNATSVSWLAKAASSSPRLRGRNPAKRQWSAGSALATSAASAADGPGSTSTSSPAATQRAHQHEAGVGDQRHAGVGDERDDLAVVHALDELGRARLLVLLVVADELAGDAVVLEQRAGAAGVLAGDQVGLAQCRQHAQRDVLEVADRRRADDQLVRSELLLPGREPVERQRGSADHAGLMAELGRDDA